MGPALIEGVERTNAIVVRGQEQGQGQGVEVPPRQDPYAIEVDQGRNYYAYGEFGYMAYHYRNRERVMEGRIKEIYDHINNLKGMECQDQKR